MSINNKKPLKKTAPRGPQMPAVVKTARLLPADRAKLAAAGVDTSGLAPMPMFLDPQRALRARLDARPKKEAESAAVPDATATADERDTTPPPRALARRPRPASSGRTRGATKRKGGR